VKSTFPRTKRTLQSGILRNQFPVNEERHTKLGEICPTARERFPFFFKLPWNDPIKLLKWRIYVRKRSVHDLAFRVAVWKMAELDAAFFTVTYAVIFEPRPFARWLPFNLWTDQVSLLSWFVEIFGVRHGAVNKTRGIGLSWLTAVFIFHAWLFKAESKIAVLTEDESKLDSQDANSLIGKFQYMFDKLPAWAKYTKNGSLKLNRSTGQHAFHNVENGAVIQGYVSREQKLRQLRFTMIFADEFAFYKRTDQDEWMTAASGCSNCVLYVSTWNDFDDMFHHIMFEGESTLLRMNAFWQNNTERWKGAYKMVNGLPLLVDKDYKHPPNYPFGEPAMISDNMLRSPWVDAELLQPGKDRSPLKALRDIYGMEVCRRTNAFFDKNTADCVEETICPPDVSGTLDVTNEGVVIRPTLKWDIRTWGGVPKKDRGPYVLFSDLAHGVDAAHSTAEVLDRFGEQVLEYGRNDLKITPFAFDVVAIARWLAGDHGDGWVLIDFEANGPLAKPFATELLRLQYGNIHQSNVKGGSARSLEDAKYFGTVNRDGGMANFRELERAILAMGVKIKSDRVLADMNVASKDEEKDNQPKFPRGRKEGHGDYLHGIGGAWWRSKNSVTTEESVLELDSRHTRRIQLPWESESGQLWSNDWQKVA